MDQIHSNELKTHVGAQFNVPHNIACAAYRILPSSAWQTWDTIRDEKIYQFKKKVSAQGIQNWNDRVKDDPRKRWGGAVKVFANNKVYKEDSLYAKGTAYTDVEMSDKELEQKFINCAKGILPKKKIDKAITYLKDLENLDNIKALMQEITL